MIYDELIEELAMTLLIKARYEGCISVIDGYKEWWDTKKKLMGASWQRDMVTNKEDKRESLMKLVGQEFVIIDDFGWPRNPDGYNKLVKRVAQKAGISDIHPHMFRHTFATSLLEADVDIRYIQEMLGHSSINVTQIYTHVAVAKQRNILATKHPRKDFHI